MDFKRSVLLFTALVALGACKTSGQLRSDDSRSDPSGIRTLDAPPAADGVVTEPSASGETLARQLVTTQAELEELRMQFERERQEWAARQQAAEEEKLKLQEALAQRTQAPPVVALSDDKNAPELLWSQAVESIQKNEDSDALLSLKSLLANYPKSRRVWGATLASGMLEYRMKNYAGAAIHFNQSIDMSAKRSVGPSLPWYFQGLAFLKLKKKDDAALFFGELNRRFPRALVNTKAKAVQSGKNRLPDDLFADVPNWLDFVGP